MKNVHEGMGLSNRFCLEFGLLISQKHYHLPEQKGVSRTIRHTLWRFTAIVYSLINRQDHLAF
jgi:hypothetical protein